MCMRKIVRHKNKMIEIFIFQIKTYLHKVFFSYNKIQGWIYENSTCEYGCLYLCRIKKFIDSFFILEWRNNLYFGKNSHELSYVFVEEIKFSMMKLSFTFLLLFSRSKCVFFIYIHIRTFCNV